MFGVGGVGGGRENEALGRLTHIMMPVPLRLDSPAEMGGGGGEEFPRRDERVPQWSQPETRDFIAIRAELERDFTLSKRNKTLWEVVAAKMKERGYRRTADQCKCKWKNLVSRYKGKETSDLDNGRQFLFFEELQSVFTERESNMRQLHLESEVGSVQSKKRPKSIGGDPSSEDISYDESEHNSDEERTPKVRRKTERERKSQKSILEREKYFKDGNSNGNFTIQEILREFFQQQQVIERQWRESVERRAYERKVFEQEWRQSMEKLERERMMIEQAWREREEQRRTREESRAEKRDALLTTLLNRLIHETHP